MSQALYRKWRPARFQDVVGQEHITRTLQNSVAADRVGHAYLFCGPRGTGKTTSARLLAKAVNCLDEDPAERPCNKCEMCVSANRNASFDSLIEIDAASNTGVDDIRDLRTAVMTRGKARFKVYIIDEVHMLSTAAFNALLKTLEEPPPHVKFVLATTEEHKVPITIKSRCQQFNFRLLTVAEISARLSWLADKEGFVMEPEAQAMIARQGSGSVRDAESLLDQLVLAPGDVITLERAQMVLGTASDTAVAQLVDHWLSKDGAGGLGLIHEALASGADARQFCRQMVVYLRELLLLQAGGVELALDGTAEHKAVMLAQAQRAPREGLITAIKRFNEAALVPAISWQPQLPLELAFIELLPAEPLPLVVVTAVPQTQTASPKAEISQKPESVSAKKEPASPKPRVEAVGGQSVEVGVKPQPVSSQPPSTKHLTLGAVTPHWREMLARVEQANRNLPALLNMGKPLAVEGKTIILGFDYPIFKDKFDQTADAIQVVSDIFSQLIGAKCLVRAVVTSEYTIPIQKEEFDALAQELGGVMREE
ncbi:MAG: DNA polymerase III subunit gamma/tau [Chloroflexi bacterium]|nr:DNA polymerase III subunit gamma/tau [Chloroflexota bacterium]MBP7042300.1 DNA polymerase III subunit gamma/tau [Chloroflexota bacterium]